MPTRSEMGSPRRAASMACPSSTGPATGASVETNEDHAEHQQPGPLGTQVRGEQAHIRTMGGPCHGPATLPVRPRCPGSHFTGAPDWRALRCCWPPPPSTATRRSSSPSSSSPARVCGRASSWCWPGSPRCPTWSRPHRGWRSVATSRPPWWAPLTDGWRFDRSAAAATLIDLAARHVLVIDQIGLDQFTVAVAPDATTNLTRVRGAGRAAGPGLGPRRAGAAGGADAARRRHRHGLVRRFHHAVRDEMRSAGLSRPRWAPWMRAVMTAVAVPPALARAWAVTLIPEDGEGGSDDGIPWALILIIAVRGARRVPSG